MRDGKLHRELVFPSFIEAFAFMTAFALVAERLNHHPEWSNAYNRVVLDLWTHSALGAFGDGKSAAAQRRARRAR